MVLSAAAFEKIIEIAIVELSENEEIHRDTNIYTGADECLFNLWSEVRRDDTEKFPTFYPLYYIVCV